MDRFTQYAVVASDEAVKDSGLVIDENNDTRVGVWIGSGIGGIQALQDGFKVLYEKGPRRVSPFFVPMMIPIWQAARFPSATGQKDRTERLSQHVRQGRTPSEMLLKSLSVARPT